MSINKAATAVWLTTLLLGCSNSTKDAQEGQQRDLQADTKRSPVVLNVWGAESVDDPEALFMNNYGKFVQQKYPHISFKVYSQKSAGTGNKSAEQVLGELVAAGVRFDLIRNNVANLTQLTDLGLASDISDLIKKYNFDLSRVQQPLLESSKVMFNGKLSGLPVEGGGLSFFYNKDLFNKFAVPAPKEGLTWNDVYEMSKRLTQYDGGVQYYAWGFHPLLFAYNQLSLPLVDGSTSRSKINSDGWVNLFRTLLPGFQINGVVSAGSFPAKVVDSTVRAHFIQDRTIAMGVWQSDGYPDPKSGAEGLNWDFAPFPSFEEKKGVGPQPNPRYLFIGANAEHRDDAFLAVARMMDEEVQLDKAANLAISGTLNSSKIQEAIGRNTPALAGKSVKWQYPANPATPVVVTENSNFARSQLVNAFKAAAVGTKDINSALREADELVNKNADLLKKQ